MQQRQTTRRSPFPAAAIARPTAPAAITAIQPIVDQDDPVVLPADLPPLPPIFIARDDDESSPKFSIDGDAVQFSKMLQTMKDVAADTENQTAPFPHYSDQQLSFIADLLNFLFREQQVAGTIQNSRVIEFITTATAHYTAIPFNQVLELVNFFDIPDAFIAITSIQPLPLPTTPTSEIEYNKQLAYVFNLARSTTYKEHNIAVGSVNLWQLFGRMLYPNCTKYPEIAKMINFITAQRGGKFVQTVRRMGQRVGSWLGAPKPSGPIVQKTIEQIVLGAYMQQHPELYLHPFRTIENANNPDFSPDGQTIAVNVGNDIKLINILDGSTIKTISHASRPVFSPDGHTLAVEVGSDTRLLNIRDGSIIRIINNAYGPAFSPDGQTIAVNVGNDIKLINILDGSTIKTISHASRPVFSPDGHTLAVEMDSDIRLINIHNGSTIRTIYKSYRPTFSPEGQTIAVSIADSYDPEPEQTRIGIFYSIKLINIHNGHTVRTIKHARAAAFNPNGKIIAIDLMHDFIDLINIHNGLTVTIGHANNPIFSLDGRILAITPAAIRNIVQCNGHLSLREVLDALI